MRYLFDLWRSSGVLPVRRRGQINIVKHAFIEAKKKTAEKSISNDR